MKYNWEKGFALDFDLITGRSKHAATTKRYLSDMKEFYFDKKAVEEQLKRENVLIYEYYELGCPERKGELSFGTTIVYPGKIGTEYYMTKGHFHNEIATSEVYYTLEGEGVMVLENPEGETEEIPLKKGEAAYVPRRYAHRSVNTGEQPLVMFYVFDADAGHDYGTIEAKGYHRMVCAVDGVPKVVDNPRRKEQVM